MIRILDVKDFDSDPAKYYKIAGLSTDTKPTASVSTGSVFIEVDTGLVYLYDEESMEWFEVENGNGGKPPLPGGVDFDAN